jgi:hypothetical protein
LLLQGLGGRGTRSHTCRQARKLAPSKSGGGYSHCVRGLGNNGSVEAWVWREAGGEGWDGPEGGMEAAGGRTASLAAKTKPRLGPSPSLTLSEGHGDCLEGGVGARRVVGESGRASRPLERRVPQGMHRDIRPSAWKDLGSASHGEPPKGTQRLAVVGDGHSRTCPRPLGTLLAALRQETKGKALLLEGTHHLDRCVSHFHTTCARGAVWSQPRSTRKEALAWAPSE